MRLCLVAIVALAIAAPLASADTITFDELAPGTPIDGITLGNITFHSPDAIVAGGPGDTVYVSDPSLLGLGGPLFLEFGTPVQDLSFGFAVDNDTAPFIPGAVAVVLFNDGEFVGAEAFDAAPLVSFNEGFVDIYSTPFDGALILFPLTGGPYDAHVIDNITAIPEPTAVALLGLGAIGLIVRRHRKRLAT